MPRISVIVPVYNTSQYLKRCIASIAAQEFVDFEVIFVDDGSTDNSYDVCSSLISRYANMRIVSKKNGGLSSARLFGLKKSVGEYVVFVDSDDYLAPDYLSTLFDAITLNKADVCMGGYYTDDGQVCVEQPLYVKQSSVIIEKAEILEKYMLPQLPSINEMDVFLPSFMWLRMFRKEVLSEDLFISERMVYLEDLALSSLLYSKISRVVIVNRPIYYYCLNSGSLTLRYRANAWNMMCSLYEILLKSVFLSDEDDEQNHRKGFLFRAIMFALRNASHKGFDEYMDTKKDICSNGYVKWLFGNTSIKSLHHQHRMLQILYYIRAIPLLFFYYRRSHYLSR